jgi:hypothetical protein
MPKNDDLLPSYQSDEQLQAIPVNVPLPADTTERMYLVVRSLK